MTMGALTPALRIRRHSSRPSISGSPISRRIASNRSRPAVVSASTAVSDSTAENSPCCSSCSASEWRNAGSSSTLRILRKLRLPSLPCCPPRSADCGTNYRFIRPIGGIYPRLRTGAAAKLSVFRWPRTCPTGGRSGRHAPKRLAHRSSVPMILRHTRYPLVEPLIPPSRDSGRAGQAIDAALSALRRGEPVLLYGQGEAVLALAAEFVNEDNLQRLRQVSARPLRAVLTRRRAVALGLARRDALSGAVSIALAPELPAGVIRNLADPAASLGADPPGLGPEPAIAEGPELAAVALAKLAALLPAVLALPPAPAAASCSTSRRRAAALAWSTNCAPTNCRTPGSTRSTPTSSSASTPTSGSICRLLRCCASSASLRCGF